MFFNLIWLITQIKFIEKIRDLTKLWTCRVLSLLEMRMPSCQESMILHQGSFGMSPHICWKMRKASRRKSWFAGRNSGPSFEVGLGLKLLFLWPILHSHLYRWLNVGILHQWADTIQRQFFPDECPIIEKADVIRQKEHRKIHGKEKRTTPGFLQQLFRFVFQCLSICRFFWL